MTMTAEMIEQNRSHLQATTPVPPGWQVTDNADPSTQKVMFWNSLEQVWSDVASTLTDEASYAKFCELWGTGTTFLIVPAPTPAPVPAPMASPFGAFPAPVAAAPAIPTPVATPVPAPVPAPVAPVASVNLAVPPTPAFVPPAPVAAVAFPAPPAAVPEAPAPVAPAAPASGFKVVGLGKKATPTPAPAPAAPVNIPATVASAVAAGASAGAVVDTPAHPKQQADAASLALLERLAKIHAAQAEQIKELAEAEKALRAEIVKLAFPNGVAEGVNTCGLPDGSALIVTGKVNRTVDPAKAVTVRDALAEAGASFDDYFEWKPSLKVGSFKVAAVNLQAIMSDMVTAKDGTPSVEIRKPKGV
jgi:hypothetical protein